MYIHTYIYYLHKCKFVVYRKDTVQYSSQVGMLRDKSNLNVYCSIQPLTVCAGVGGGIVVKSGRCLRPENRYRCHYTTLPVNHLKVMLRRYRLQTICGKICTCTYHAEEMYVERLLQEIFGAEYRHN